MKKIIQVHIYKGEQFYVAECIDLPSHLAQDAYELAANCKKPWSFTSPKWSTTC
jgi:hypothetical protein